MSNIAGLLLAKSFSFHFYKIATATEDCSGHGTPLIEGEECLSTLYLLLKVLLENKPLLDSNQSLYWLL
jgi:hypothetical protein